VSEPAGWEKPDRRPARGDRKLGERYSRGEDSMIERIGDKEAGQGTSRGLHGLRGFNLSNRGIRG